MIFSCLAKLVELGINIARVSDSIPTGAPPAQNVFTHILKGSTKWPIFIFEVRTVYVVVPMDGVLSENIVIL